MTRYVPRRAPGLPPGQRLLQEMPRFTDRPNLPPPKMFAEPRLEITHGGATLAVVSAAGLAALRPREQLGVARPHAEELDPRPE